MLKLLHFLSGDDHTIIKRCNNGIQKRFAMIGLLVLIIFFLCFLSLLISVVNIFNSSILAVPLALFFAWMITNIYLLLLYTLSKKLIKQDKAEYNLRGALIARTLFICFISIVISQPIGLYLFKGDVKPLIETFRKEKLISYQESIEAITSSKIAEMSMLQERSGDVSPDGFYAKQIAALESQRINGIRKMQTLIAHSNYYAQSLRLLAIHVPQSWLITLIVVLIFLMPAYIKFFISEFDDYNVIRRNVENRLIMDEYQNFKFQYQRILRNRYKVQETFSETFEDPPFNTRRVKDVIHMQSESDLRSILYTDR